MISFSDGSAYMDLLKNIKDRKKCYAVLGLDVYQYSQHSRAFLDFVPPIFDLFFRLSIKLCLTLEPWLFPIKEEEFLFRAKHTGDGGLVLFDSPIHALVFNVYFHFCNALMNAGLIYQKITAFFEQSRKDNSNSKGGLGEEPVAVERIVFRSAMAQGVCYDYNPTQRNKMYFGDAYLNCARVLSKDNLDRFLIDQTVRDFFVHWFQGIENLPECDPELFRRQMMEWQKATSKNPHQMGKGGLHSFLFQSTNHPFHPNNNAFVEGRSIKLGKTRSKLTLLDIYNLEVKVRINTHEILDAIKHVEKDCVGNVAEHPFPEWFNLVIGNPSSHSIMDE